MVKEVDKEYWTKYYVGGVEVLVLIDKHKGNSNVIHIELFLQRKGCITCYLPRRLAAGMVNNPATFTQSVLLRLHWTLKHLS